MKLNAVFLLPILFFVVHGNAQTVRIPKKITPEYVWSLYMAQKPSDDDIAGVICASKEPFKSFAWKIYSGRLAQRIAAADARGSDSVLDAFVTGSIACAPEPYRGRMWQELEGHDWVRFENIFLTVPEPYKQKAWSIIETEALTKNKWEPVYTVLVSTYSPRRYAAKAAELLLEEGANCYEFLNNIWRYAPEPYKSEAKFLLDSNEEMNRCPSSPVP